MILILTFLLKIVRLKVVAGVGPSLPGEDALIILTFSFFQNFRYSEVLI